MPIDSTTLFRRVELAFRASYGIPAAGVSASVRQTNNRPLRVPRLSSGDYDPEDPQVAETISRIKSGTPVVYITGDSYLRARLGIDSRTGVRDDQLPEAYHHLRDTHPFHANYVVPDKSRGPYVDVFYQRAATAPAVTTVAYSGLESIGAYERRVQNDGWLMEPPTGADALWHSVVRYGVYASGEGWTHIEPAKSADINWSTDSGDTWLHTVPTDYADVTDVRLRHNERWITVPVFVDPDHRSPWVALSVHRDVLPLPLDSVLAMEVAGAALADLYQLGIRMDVMHPDGTILRSGEAWISSDYGRRSHHHPFGLEFIPVAHLYDDAPPAPYRYIAAQDNLTGHVQIHHTGANIDRLPTTVSAAYLSFGGFPTTALNQAMGDAETDTSFRTSIPNVGFRIGDILHIDDEQVRIAANNEVPFRAAVINVERAVNGTTRAAHVIGSVVRGVVREDALHQVHVWEEDNTLVARTRMSVLGLRRVD